MQIDINKSNCKNKIIVTIKKWPIIRIPDPKGFSFRELIRESELPFSPSPLICCEKYVIRRILVSIFVELQKEPISSVCILSYNLAVLSYHMHEHLFSYFTCNTSEYLLQIMTIIYNHNVY